MKVTKTYYVTHWIVIYLADSIIHPLNNQEMGELRQCESLKSTPTYAQIHDPYH